MYLQIEKRASVWDTLPSNEFIYAHVNEMWLIISHIPLFKFRSSTAREAAAADGPPEEPHFPSDPRPTGCPGPN